VIRSNTEVGPSLRDPIDMYTRNVLPGFYYNWGQLLSLRSPGHVCVRNIGVEIGISLGVVLRGRFLGCFGVSPSILAGTILEGSSNTSYSNKEGFFLVLVSPKPLVFLLFPIGLKLPFGRPLFLIIAGLSNIRYLSYVTTSPSVLWL
jgi:hypothetical protein